MVSVLLIVEWETFFLSVLNCINVFLISIYIVLFIIYLHMEKKHVDVGFELVSPQHVLWNAVGYFKTNLVLTLKH